MVSENGSRLLLSWVLYPLSRSSHLSPSLGFSNPQMCPFFADHLHRRKSWLADGARLGKILRRIAPILRRVGTDVQLDTPRRRMITIRKGRDFAVITDMPPQEPQENDAIGADGHDSNRDSNVGSDSTSPITATVHARGDEGVERLLHDSTDSNDSKIHNLSNEEVLEF